MAAPIPGFQNPQWIPGAHSPVGPFDKLAGITIGAGGRPVAWERDQGNVYAFHLTVPEGVDSIGVDFEFLSPQNRDEGRVVMTPEMLNLQWNTVVLYPAGFYARRIQVAPRVTLPHGWQPATALEVQSRSGDSYRFKVIDLLNERPGAQGPPGARSAGRQGLRLPALRPLRLPARPDRQAQPHRPGTPPIERERRRRKLLHRVGQVLDAPGSPPPRVQPLLGRQVPPPDPASGAAAGPWT